MEEVSGSKHLCVMVRISNFYLAMTVIQLSLATAIIVFLHYSMMEAISLVELWVFFFISLDLLIKYFSEEQHFFKNRWNWMDILILIITSFSIFVDILYPNKFNHRNNIMEAGLMIARYIVQFYRVVTLIKVSKQIREQQISTNAMINLNSIPECDTDMVEVDIQVQDLNSL